MLFGLILLQFLRKCLSVKHSDVCMKYFKDSLFSNNSNTSNQFDCVNLYQNYVLKFVIYQINFSIFYSFNIQYKCKCSLSVESEKKKKYPLCLR